MLRADRNHRGLFPESRMKGGNSRPWNRWSILDMCVARLCISMVKAGARRRFAVIMAEEFRCEFAKVLVGGLSKGRYPIHRFNEGHGHEILWVVDPQAVVFHVFERLVASS